MPVLSSVQLRLVGVLAVLLGAESAHHSLLRRAAPLNTSSPQSITAAAVPGVAANINATGGAEQKRQPRVYFLFMAVDKISNLGVWRTFFAQAPMSQYRAFVHCKFPSCVQQIAGSPLVAVSTVPSYYCTDLVSPMNQLLAHALNHDGDDTNPMDKFAFISDSSLPAKPFSQIYSTLSARQGSDFCAFPSAEWADLRTGSGSLEVAVKHHQWITLDRGHATKASSLWSSGYLHGLMTQFSMNTVQYSWANNSYGDSRNFGCLDEFWHMAALYGPLQNVIAGQAQELSLPGFVSGPLRIADGQGWQGECDTFVVWAKYLHTPGPNPFSKLHSSLDPPSIPHSGTDQRPGWWDKISTFGISQIRNSDFLFVRKFVDGPSLTDGGNFELAYAQGVLFT